MSSSFDKVTTGKYNFVSFIWNVASDGALPPVISAKTQFFDQFKINSTSQLIDDAFTIFQKLLKCFSGITTFASVNESLSSGIFPTILVLYLTD